MNIHSCLEPVAMQVDTERTSIFIVHHSSFYFGRLWGGRGEICQLYHYSSGNLKSIPLSSLQSRNINNPPARQSIISKHCNEWPIFHTPPPKQLKSGESNFKNFSFIKKCFREFLRMGKTCNSSDPSTTARSLDKDGNLRLDWTFRVSLR